MANLGMEVKCRVIVQTFEKLEDFMTTMTVSWMLIGIKGLVSVNSPFMELIFTLFAFPSICWTVVSVAELWRKYKQSKKEVR